MTTAGASRSELIKSLWPDKALYASTLLVITGVLGLLSGVALFLLLRVGDIKFGSDLPGILRSYPPELTMLLSAGTAILGYLALRLQRRRLAFAGAVCGVLSMGLVGLGSLLSLVALVFVFLSRREGEHESQASQGLAAHMWPDKSLAASIVALVTGVVTAGWGYVLATTEFEFAGYGIEKATFGWACIVVGLVGIVAAYLLYHQRGALVGVLVSVASIFALGLYFVGPVLGLVTLFLLWQAWREDEFKRPAAAGPSAPAGAPKATAKPATRTK